MLFNVAHGGVDLGTNVVGLRQREQVVETRLGAEIEDAFGVISCRLIHKAATARRCACGFELGTLSSKTDFGKAQEDQTKDRSGVFLRLEAGVGAELVSGVPKAFFQGGSGGVFFGRCDPVHSFYCLRNLITQSAQRSLPRNL